MSVEGVSDEGEQAAQSALQRAQTLEQSNEGNLWESEGEKERERKRKGG